MPAMNNLKKFTLEQAKKDYTPYLILSIPLLFLVIFLLWPLGIMTSAVYIYVFRENGFYAGMVLQFYYLAISIYGWWAWKHGAMSNEHGKGKDDHGDHEQEHPLQKRIRPALKKREYRAADRDEGPGRSTC